MPRLRPDAATALLHALGLRLGDSPYRVEQLTCRSWASATFSGTRHKLVLSVAPEAADRFLDGIEEAELATPGHVVADICLVSSEPDGLKTRIALEALTIEAD